MQLCIQLGIYKVYNGAQGYGVEGWAHRKGRGLVDRDRVGDTGVERGG